MLSEPARKKRRVERVESKVLDVRVSGVHPWAVKQVVDRLKLKEMKMVEELPVCALF